MLLTSFLLYNHIASRIHQPNVLDMCRVRAASRRTASLSAHPSGARMVTLLAASQPAMRLPFGRSSSWGRSGIQIAKRFQKLFPADFIKNHENQKKSVKFGTKCNF
jgi:hypothetical protein